MSQALKVAHEDAEAMWVARIRKHLMSAEPGLAQKVLAEAVAAGVTGPDIERLQKLLGPPRVRLSPLKSSGLEAECRWIKRNASSYRGQWVALRGENLLAHGETLSEVMSQLDADPSNEPPFVHYLRLEPVF
jgi:hypothetical protein